MAHDRYRPLTPRRRLLVLLLAVATAITVILVLLDPPGGVQRVRRFPTACGPGTGSDCVGGKSTVLAPAAAPVRSTVAAPDMSPTSKAPASAPTGR